MTLLLGIIGKPSSGKSTFLNAACMTNVKTSSLPFTTIKPNKGIAYAKTKCVCKELDVEDEPQNSICTNGNRFIPVNILDVAGLVPGAHEGKGLGNRFLNDLSQADVLIHIVDITGSLDKSGNLTAEGTNDPYEDILFLEEEINLWYKQILEREDWEKFKRNFARDRKIFVDALHNRLSGIKVNKRQILISLKNANLENKNPSKWNEEDRYNFSKILREISKPIIIAANKIDKDEDLSNFNKLKEKVNSEVIPCTALAEYYLRKYAEDDIIKYVPGTDHFQIKQSDKLNSKEIAMIEKIQEKILSVLGGCGVQNVINYAVFSVAKQICVYPVSDVQNLSNNDGNVLPDVFLVKKGIKLKDFIAKHIHSDLAEHFLYGIDARTKKRLSDTYVIRNDDVVKIVSTK